MGAVSAIGFDHAGRPGRSAALRASGIGAACMGGDPRWVFEHSVAIEIDMAPWLFSVVPVEAGRVLRATASVTVLAYRDRTDSILEFAEPAVMAATASRRPFRLGVETMLVGPGVPPETTFADDGAAVLNRELAVVDAELADNPHYRGVAVHHWAAWRDLRP